MRGKKLNKKIIIAILGLITALIGLIGADKIKITQTEIKDNTITDTVISIENY